MFDHVGKNLDEEANKRRAASLAITLGALGSGLAIVLVWSAWRVVEVAPKLLPASPMVEVLIADLVPQLAAPPPPLAAGAKDQHKDEAPPTPDDLQEQVLELKPVVDQVIQEQARGAGSESGLEVGQPGGVPNGTPGGSAEGGPCGDLCGDPGGVRSFHASELQVKKRVTFHYPDAAKDLNLGQQRCLIKVLMDETGTPYDATVEGCPPAFHADARQTVLGWRWYPPKSGKNKVKAQTMIGVTYQLQ